MSFVPSYRYIDASTLADVIKAQKTETEAAKTGTAIVDVRDDDFVGGNIPGAINVPSTQFEDKIGDLVLGPLKDFKQVVFHCSLSQQRGPKAARIYRETRDAAIAGGKIPARPASASTEGEEQETGQKAAASGDGQQVLVLRDGFAGFGAKYNKDRDLVENWDEESWKYR